MLLRLLLLLAAGALAALYEDDWSLEDEDDWDVRLRVEYFLHAFRARGAPELALLFGARGETLAAQLRRGEGTAEYAAWAHNLERAVHHHVKHYYGEEREFLRLVYSGDDEEVHRQFGRYGLRDAESMRSRAKLWGWGGREADRAARAARDRQDALETRARMFHACAEHGNATRTEEEFGALGLVKARELAQLPERNSPAAARCESRCASRTAFALRAVKDYFGGGELFARFAAQGDDARVRALFGERGVRDAAEGRRKLLPW